MGMITPIPHINELENTEKIFNPDIIKPIRRLKATNFGVKEWVIDEFEKYGFTYNIEFTRFESKYKFDEYILDIYISKHNTEFAYLELNYENGSVYKRFSFKESFMNSNPLNLLYNFKSSFNDIIQKEFRCKISILKIIKSLLKNSDNNSVSLNFPSKAYTSIDDKLFILCNGHYSSFNLNERPYNIEEIYNALIQLVPNKTFSDFIISEKSIQEK